MSLSARWAGSSHRAIAAAGSDVQMLALALGPVRNIIRVIDDHTPAMAVDWASIGKDDQGRPMSDSYTDFAGGRIAVNPMPIVSLGRTDSGRAIDIVSGFAMHEASHGKHSRDRYRDLITVREGLSVMEVPAFRPLRVAAALWNIAEDVRIEGATSSDWPGFAPYFDAVLDWVLDDIRNRRDLPKTYGTSVAQKMRVVFFACRYPNLRLGGVDAAETAWWKGWQADYLAGRTSVKQMIERGLDHLGEDEETKQEMEEMSQEEAREEARGENLKAQLDRLMKEGIPGAYNLCITEGAAEHALTGGVAAEISQLIREGLVVIMPTGGDPGATCEAIRVTKPEEGGASRAAYIGKPDSSVEALRAALVFRQERPRYDIKLQKSGQMDDEELYRWSIDDMRLFTERVIEGRPDTLMGLLVDLSGSMTGARKLQTAQRLAQLLVWALHDQDGVETRVWGHTADIHGAAGSDVYRLWEPGDPLTRLGLVETLPHANNSDGHAIAYCLSQMVEMPQPQKVLVVLADGRPQAQGYHGDPARRHIRSVVDGARRQGIQVIQIAIDAALDMHSQSAMFGSENVVPFTTETALPRQLTQVLARWT